MPTKKRRAGDDDRRGTRPVVAEDSSVNLAFWGLSKVLLEIAMTGSHLDRDASEGDSTEHIEEANNGN